MYASLSLSIYIYIRICVYIYIYIYTHTRMFIYRYMSIHVWSGFRARAPPRRRRRDRPRLGEPFGGARLPIEYFSRLYNFTNSINNSSNNNSINNNNLGLRFRNSSVVQIFSICIFDLRFSATRPEGVASGAAGGGRPEVRRGPGRFGT